ncbi:NAD-dependent succinate-semialdehyde dehydrogenase [Vibrio sp. S4M6]|uniref:NAD-dependent succinate-semialdehyde dehydrogenase n=1 Tax=Vibrio sinus TaxID=2946865 RepID=UPI00202AAD71|nr:NAD-dependent succinate-semialdehyde dehydrogenase [Vibrio sinus]MCL9780290.1 NAD-dependent succinate-semialdehyde dehydrogenase [Vibrio sinus]
MKTLDVINPSTGTQLNSYPIMSEEKVMSVIAEVGEAQKDWRESSWETRRKLILNVAALLRKDSQKYAEIITQEMGKPITQALREIEKCAFLCEYYAETAQGHLQPREIQAAHSKTYVSYQPLGVIFAIMPWNFPFWQVLRFAVPNIMGGNAALLKHAPNSTGAALAIEALFQEAGFPEHLFRSLVIDVDVVQAIIEHPLIQGVTLTGSGKAGAIVGAETATALKKVVLELGGSDPYVILKDADLDHAVSQCIESRLDNAGQVCISAKRLIVEEDIYDTFVEKVKAKVQEYQCNDPMDPSTNIGPMAREDLMHELDNQVQRSISAGATCLLGGKPLQREGYFYQPTLLVDVKEGIPAYHEELFGPVVCVVKAKDEEDAIRISNDSVFGLAGAVFTQDLEKGERIAREKIQVGACAVNTKVASDPRLPFGGIKESGFGRELSAEGIHEFMNVKTVIVN